LESVGGRQEGVQDRIEWKREGGGRGGRLHKGKRKGLPCWRWKLCAAASGMWGRVSHGLARELKKQAELRRKRAREVLEHF
jgi:hypothetical protein